MGRERTAAGSGVGGHRAGRSRRRCRGRNPVRAAAACALIAALLAGARPAAAAVWSLEAFLGTSFSAHSKLTVRQEGEPVLEHTAHWETRPFNDSPYYALRLARWGERWGLHLDLLHHKIYLDNPTPEIQKFEITYGYNLVSIAPAWRSGAWTLFVGVGPVLTNPSSIIRNQERRHEGGLLGTGYHVDGVHAQLGVNRRFRVGDTFFLTADLRGSAAWANVDVAGGEADVPNYAVHLLIGIGLGSPRGH
jgi:hypothetical protein